MSRRDCAAIQQLPFKLDLEELAVGSWFSNYVLYERDPETHRGFWELVKPAHVSVRKDSALAKAAVALAMYVPYHPHCWDI